MAISSSNSVRKREAVLSSVLSSPPTELSLLRLLRACCSTNSRDSQCRNLGFQTWQHVCRCS